MNFNKINELKPQDLNCNVFDVYSYDGLSMQELLCQFFTKINECIKTSNETIDLAQWLVNEGLKQEVVIKLTNWLNDGTLENLINVTLFENLNNKIDNVSSKLEQSENKTSGFISITEFGAHSCDEIGFENFDNVNAIQEALLYAKENNIAEVRIPSGVFLTSQIDFKGISQIKLIGYISKYYPDNTNQRGSVLKIINDCDVAIKFSYFNENSSSIYSMSNTIENIKIDCNNKAMNGINLNFDIHLNNVAVVNAIENGIVLESYTYPVTLNNVFCAYNGKNGIITRGIGTTVYSLNNCEFSRNNGYGMFIANGANVSFDNITCQSNKRGGIKIQYRKTDKEYYLQDISFKNLYLENNGLLSEGEEGFDGNWGLYLYSEYTEETGYNCVRNIYFNSCALNKSSVGKTLKINGGYNIKFENMLFNGNSIFDILDNYRVKYIEYDCPSSELYANIFPSQSNICKKSVNSYGIKYNKLYYDAGRPQNYKFYLKDLSSWGTLYAQNLNSNIKTLNSEVLGEPLLIKTDIIRITGYKLVQEGSSGTIRINLIKEKIAATGNGEVVTDINGNKCSYDWNLSTQGTFFDKIISPNTITIEPGYSIGLKVESRGHSNGDNSEYVFNLLCTC